MKQGCTLTEEEKKEREARSVALEKAYVHDVYDQLSGRFSDERYRPWPKIRQFLEQLEPGSLLCDAGCGNGKYLSLNSSVYKVGSDRCSPLTDVARKKGHEVLICDTLSLPFRDETFDAALSVAVIHHLATRDRRIRALRELARVLRVGGRLLITVWAKEQRHRKFESQDILVPWSTPERSSSEDKPSSQDPDFTSTTTSDDDITHYHAYTQTSDSDSCYSCRNRIRCSEGKVELQCERCLIHSEAPEGFTRRKLRSRHKGRSVDPRCPSCSSQSSSDLSSPGETCYSFVRKALQKLASSRRGRGVHARRWFTVDQYNKSSLEGTVPHLRQPTCIPGPTLECPIELRLLDPDEESIPNPKCIPLTEPNGERSRSSPPSLGGKRDSNISTSTEPPVFPRPLSSSSLISIVQNARSRSLSDILHTLPASVSSWFRGRKSSDEYTAEQQLNMLSKSHSAASWVLPGYFSTALVFGQEEKKSSTSTDPQQGQAVEITETVRRRQMFAKQKKTVFMSAASWEEECMSGSKLRTSFESSDPSKKVYKQGSLNDSWFSHDRILEREQLKQSIRKQTSLADDRVLTANIPELVEDQIHDRSGSFQKLLDNVDIPTDFTSLTNSLMRMWQAWRRDSVSVAETTTTECPPASKVDTSGETVASKDQQCDNPLKVGAEGAVRSPLRIANKDTEFNFSLSKCCPEQELTYSTRATSQRQSYREEGSDSSKDSSLQSDTSIDSEDSCISVIFIPRPEMKNQLGDELNKTRTSSSSSSEGSERSPKVKHFPPTPISELPETQATLVNEETAQPAKTETSPPQTEPKVTLGPSQVKTAEEPNTEEAKSTWSRTSQQSNRKVAKPDDDERIEVIRKSGSSGAQLYKKSVPRFLSFEVFNPETDDVDSDSSSESSSDTAGSVISVGGDPMWPAFQDRRPTILTPSIAELIRRQGQLKHENMGTNTSVSTGSDKEVSEKDSVPDYTVEQAASEERQSSNSRMSLEMVGEEEENEQIDKFENESGIVDCVGSLLKDKTKRSFSASTSSLDSSFSAPSLSSARHSSSASVLSELRKNSDDSALLPAMALLKPRTCPTPAVRKTASKASSVSEEELRFPHCTCPKLPRTQIRDRPSDNSLSVSTSQDSLPSDSGGALSLHRYYHVFREGELDQLIERHVENLHIISSYYDHANWCIVAEKVHVWTI